MACMHICVASRCIKRNAPCVAFSSLYRASPLSHVIMENPTTSHTSDKTQSPLELFAVCVIRQKTGNICPRESTCFDSKPKSPTKHKTCWFIFTGQCDLLCIELSQYFKPMIQSVQFPACEKYKTIGLFFSFPWRRGLICIKQHVLHGDLSCQATE